MHLEICFMPYFLKTTEEAYCRIRYVFTHVFLIQEIILQMDIWVILTKCEVKTAGYWSSSVLSVYGPRRLQKRTTPISSHLDRTYMVNEAFGEIFLAGHGG